jgi:uncharacterized protein 030L
MNNKELLNEILLENSTLNEALKGAEYTSQTEALIQMLMGNNVFLSGPAGSGKSFVIRKYCELVESFNPKVKIHKTSTTGLSAINIGGQTIQSFSGMGIYKHTYEDYLKLPGVTDSGLYRGSLFKIRSSQILIIDEVSMLSARDLQFLVDRIKDIKKNIKYLQIIVSGDFTQLQPVATKKDIETYGTDLADFCYGTKAWEELNFSLCYLDKIQRTSDRTLKELLDNISLGNGLSKEVADTIRTIPTSTTKYKPGVALLVSTNYQVDKINEDNHKINKGELFTNKTWCNPRTPEDSEKYAFRELKLPEILKVKHGDTIMITANESSAMPYSVPHIKYNLDNKERLIRTSEAKNLKNGMIGTFELIDNEPYFKYYDSELNKTFYYRLSEITYAKEEVTPAQLKEREELKKSIKDNILEHYTKEEVKAYKSKKNKYLVSQIDSEVEDELAREMKKRKLSVILAECAQYPIKLAYAISIHKSQGQSFDNITVDLTNCWTPGLGYVALSRATSLNGISLLRNESNGRVLNKNAILVTEESINIKKDIMKKSKELRKANLDFYKKLFNGKIDFIELLKETRPRIFPKVENDDEFPL